MERDISNTFIHNLIEERIQDLSNNPQAQFLGMLVNMLNGNSNFNSNLCPKDEVSKVGVSTI